MIDSPNQDTLKLLVSAVQNLSLARTLDAVMKIVRTTARQLTGADGATFILKDGDFCFYADEDAISPLWKGNRFPMHHCISGWSMIHKKSVVIEDIYADERIPHDAYRPTFVKSLAMVPIRTISPIGAIGNYWGDHHQPTQHEVELLQSLADITAVSIENVQVYADLEQRVKDRTIQLEGTNKELESFSYSVSHDLRAPLRSIIGFSEILKDENFDQLTDAGKRALTTVQKSAVRMNTLIDDLLQFSKVGKKEMEKTLVRSKDLVGSILEELQPVTSDHVSITVSELHSVEADHNLLRQVWANLITNALKYSSKKENPRIDISSYKSGNEIVFVVKDNGAGFNMKYADKLFGTFQRFHKESEFPGTGVGLALAQRIINRHGGKIWADAKVDAGATFFFSLPVHE